MNMERILRKIAPRPVRLLVKRFTFNCRRIWYEHAERPAKTGETSKARARRLKEGLFDKFCKGKGLDVGYGGDLVVENCQGWDIEHGDAQKLEGLPDAEYDFVYSSHTLEHLDDIEEALRSWWRVLKPGGYLILYLPDRDLYERKKTLPSSWNETHKVFFKLEKNDPPDTVGVIPLVEKTLSGCEIIYAKVCDQGYESKGPKAPCKGEYSIEAVVKKT